MKKNIVEESRIVEKLKILLRSGQRPKWEVLNALEDSSTRFDQRVAARIACGDSAALVRDDAVELLGVCGTTGDLYLLELLSRDKEWMVRCSVASSVAMIGGRKAVPILKRLLTDKNPIVRLWAATAIGDLGQVKLLPVLVDRLKYEKDEVAKIGLYTGMILLGGPRHVAELVGHVTYEGAYAKPPQADPAVSCLEDLLEEGLLTNEEKAIIRDKIPEVIDQLGPIGLQGQLEHLLEMSKV